MPRLVAKHALATRWLHWVNLPLITAMIGSGLLIYWASDVYRVGLGGWTLLRLFPDWFYQLLGLDHRLATGMGWHFAFAWPFAANGLAWVAYTLASGEWRELFPRRRDLWEAWQVVLHDLGLRRAPLPPGRFNAAQRITYSAIMVMGAASTLTGLAIYRPVQLGWLTRLCGGYQAARFEHFWLMMGFVAFFALHLIQVARAGWNNLRAMVIGVELVQGPGAVGARPRAPTAPPAVDQVTS